MARRTTLGAVKVAGKSLKDQQIVMLGAGSAGIGVADGLRCGHGRRVCRTGGAATSGSLTKAVFCIQAEKASSSNRVYAQPEDRVSGWPQTPKGHIGLGDVIGKIEATILIGLSTVGGAFTEAIVREMGRKVDRRSFSRSRIRPPNRKRKQKDLIPVD